MNLTTLDPETAQYPVGLQRYLAAEAPKRIVFLGNQEILRRRTLALFCSVKCPGSAILQTHDLAQGLRAAGIPAMSGFHSSVERECLTILLRGTQPIIVCPARSIEAMRTPAGFKQALDQGRLLLLSSFAAGVRRATVQTAAYRNRLVAALASAVFVAHAEPSSTTEQLCEDVLAWGKPLYTLSCSENILALGARPLNVDQIHKLAC